MIPSNAVKKMGRYATDNLLPGFHVEFTVYSAGPSWVVIYLLDYTDKKTGHHTSHYATYGKNKERYTRTFWNMRLGDVEVIATPEEVAERTLKTLTPVSDFVRGLESIERRLKRLLED